MKRIVVALLILLVLIASAAVVAGWTWDEDHARSTAGSTIIT